MFYKLIDDIICYLMLAFWSDRGIEYGLSKYPEHLFVKQTYSSTSKHSSEVCFKSSSSQLWFVGKQHEAWMLFLPVLLKHLGCCISWKLISDKVFISQTSFCVTYRDDKRDYALVQKIIAAQVISK